MRVYLLLLLFVPAASFLGPAHVPPSTTVQPGLDRPGEKGRGGVPGPSCGSRRGRGVVLPLGSTSTGSVAVEQGRADDGDAMPVGVGEGAGLPALPQTKEGLFAMLEGSTRRKEAFEEL